MVTEVIMERQFLSGIVKQKSKSGFFNASEFMILANKWRNENNMKAFDYEYWISSKPTKEFIATLEAKYGQVKIAGRGKGTATWLHPYLFIDLALAVNPNIKVQVYEWLFDSLLQNRNESGDSYKKMCGALFKNTDSPSTFSKFMQNTAEKIRIACGVDDWNKADEKQLKLRDKIHENISLLCDVLRDNSQAVRISIEKAIEM